MNEPKAENENSETTEINHTTENIKSVGQIIIGGLETVGGILTGDPTTRAEGDFNVSVGEIHQDSNKALTAIDDEHKRNNTTDDTQKSE